MTELSVDVDATSLEPDPIECAICGDYTAQGVEVHKVCLEGIPEICPHDKMPWDAHIL